jgi:hypothetical protein
MQKQVFFSGVAEDEALPSIKKKIARLFDAAAFADCIAPKDLVAIKIHFGEKGGDGHINPQLAKAVSEKIKALKARPFFTDTNTLYAGSRSNSHDHLMVAAEHGYSIEKLGAPVIIADGLRGRNQVEVKIEGGKHFKSVRIASDILVTDAIVALTHVTGHIAAGYAGAIKNIGMGCAARAGKLAQHSNILPEIIKDKCTGCGTCVKWCPEHAIAVIEKKAQINQSLCITCGECNAVCNSGAVKYTWGNTSTLLSERIAEHAFGALKDKKGKCVFMNFIMKFTRDCDCMPKKLEKMIPDVGILASKDIVAIDRASIDLVNKAAGKDIFKEMTPHLDYMSQCAHGQSLGLGSQDYDLVEI